MYGNGAGQGGTVLLGLFIYLGRMLLLLLWLEFLAAVGLVILVVRCSRWLYRRHQEKKLGQGTALADPPLPFMSKVQE